MTFSKDDKDNKKRTTFQGTGFLIARNIVLTCAHNIYDLSTKKEFS
jgi:hypothetical protein